MPETMMLRKQDASAAPLPHQDYALHLLQYAAEQNLLDTETLSELRDGLHRAAAERAEQYTAGRSSTVTRRQAEAFYASVFTQLDAVLLAERSDAAALDALRTRPLTELLEQGAFITLQAYETAKEQFRRAYRLTKPVQTSFFHALLIEFEQFCTKYDARFNAKDTKVAYSYPLLCGRQIAENGAIGVCSYYTSLAVEGEFLQCFDTDEIGAMMRRYAGRFRTSPDMIAENIAELVLRHWVIALLGGKTGFSAAVTPEMIETVQAEYGNVSAEILTDTLCRKITEQLGEAYPNITKYLTAALPAFTAAMQERMMQGRLEGWLAPLDINAEDLK